MSLVDLNWRKGLFRFWLLVSFIWIAVFGIFGLYPTVSKYTIVSDKLEKFMIEPMDGQVIPHLRKYLTKSEDEQSKKILESQIIEEQNLRSKELLILLEAHDKQKQNLLFYSVMAVVPPVVVLILGMGFMWVLSGFAQRQSK